jgi:PPP family 3-phenylpropionic acid transporter
MSFAVRLALLYAGIFAAIGVQMPFLPLWLEAKGLDAPTIGALLAAGTATRLIAVPLGTRAADRFAGPRPAILIAALAGAAATTLLGFANGTAVLFAVYALATAAWAIVIPLAESYALRNLPARGRAYGPVRLWGSAGYIAATLAAGSLMTVIAPVQLIWLVAIGYWLGAGAALLLEPESATAPDVRQPAAPAAGRIDRRLVLVLAASSLVQASHSQFYGFGTLQWTAAGLSGLAIGVLWAVSIAVEIALFAFSARLPAALGSPLSLLLLGAVGGAVRWTAMALDPGTAWLPWLQALHGLSFAATHLGAVQFVARAAAPGRAATAQGSLAWTNGAAMAGAMAVSGFLYSAHGAGGYFAMAALAAAGGVCALGALRLDRAARRASVQA